MTTADERWVAYTDVSLWSSPELGAGHEIVRLNRGDLVKVLGRGSPGMAEVRTEDLRHGWVRTIELTDYQPSQMSAAPQPVAAQSDPATVAAPLPYEDPTMGYAYYGSVHTGDSEGGGLTVSEPAQEAAGFFHGIFDAIGNAFSSIGDAIGDFDLGDFGDVGGGDFGGFD
ncbi:MAG TPA: hypothetical protein VFY54_21190 [Rubrobacter sp.]|nr:hypothetical protein [Rubrobacter sp.]